LEFFVPVALVDSYMTFLFRCESGWLAWFSSRGPFASDPKGGLRLWDFFGDVVICIGWGLENHFYRGVVRTDRVPVSYMAEGFRCGSCWLGRLRSGRPFASDGGIAVAARGKSGGVAEADLLAAAAWICLAWKGCALMKTVGTAAKFFVEDGV
jgi:hypothetical protein